MDRVQLRRNLVDMCEASSLDTTDINDNAMLKDMGMRRIDVNDILDFIGDSYGVRPKGITIESTFGDLIDTTLALLQ
jgi:hypothetical protein